MELILQRTNAINETQFGELSINGKFFCYTLEDKIRSGKIKGKTCIPEGTYKIAVTPSERFKCVLPILLNVKGFEGIRIHAGNTNVDTCGCLLVGGSIKGETLLQSKVTLNKLLPIIQKAIKTEEVKIKIINPTIAELSLEKNQEPQIVQIIKDMVKPEVEIQPIEIPNSDRSQFIKNLITWLTKFFYKKS